jgi:hypothetical protein
MEAAGQWRLLVELSDIVPAVAATIAMWALLVVLMPGWD